MGANLLTGTAPTLRVAGLGPCMAGWCDRDGAVYVSGPTHGRSPRLLIIAGERADQLAAGEHGVQVRCVDCAVAALEQMCSLGNLEEVRR